MERFTQVSTPPPFLHGGEDAFSCNWQRYRRNVWVASQKCRESRNAYPLTRRWREHRPDLLSPRLSAFYVQREREPQTEEAAEASESWREKQTSASARHRIHEEQHTREIRSTNTPFYYFLLCNAGGRKFRRFVSRNFWRAAARRLNRKAQNIQVILKNTNAKGWIRDVSAAFWIEKSKNLSHMSTVLVNNLPFFRSLKIYNDRQNMNSAVWRALRADLWLKLMAVIKNQRSAFFNDHLCRRLFI